MGGLACAIDLSRRGVDVQLFERGPAPGGKLRAVDINHHILDAGPTVFTMPRVFDELFDAAGDDFRSRIALVPATVLARHCWRGSEPLDLFADLQQSAAAIERFGGHREAQGFLRFSAQARRIYESLDRTFMRAPRPSPLGLAQRIGFLQLATLWNIRPFATLWNATGEYFHDPRLRQLFARYATYCGSSPFASPATLMLIAHVERDGVWYLKGGMRQLALELAALAQRLGCRIRYRAPITAIETAHGRVSAVRTREGERFEVDAVVCNGDTNALAQGFLGEAVRAAVKPTPPQARTLSALTVNAVARTRGFHLAHHNVFFGADYREEFKCLFDQRSLPQSPTIYVCAQDRVDEQVPPTGQRERLLCLINAPATGDSHCYASQETESWTTRIFDSLQDCGLQVLCEPGATQTTTPEDFHHLFPATGGSLYGPASHGWRASFLRPGSRSSIPGLYLAGGSTHPGPGVPMAAISGRLAADCIMADLASM